MAEGSGRGVGGHVSSKELGDEPEVVAEPAVADGVVECDVGRDSKEADT